MPAFTTEAAVRLIAQIDDTAIASTALVEAGIAEAHDIVLAGLSETVDQEDPPQAVVQGEALLAAAALMRSLASRDAVDQVELQIGGQRIDAGKKFASLMSISHRFEKEAEKMLAPFGVLPGAAAPGDITPSTPILGA